MAVPGPTLVSISFSSCESIAFSLYLFNFVSHTMGVASAHAALGMIFHIDGDMEAAISEYRLAIDLNPSLADSHHSLGAALIPAGRKRHFRI